MVYLKIGRRKRGKTTLAYYMVRKSPKRVIFDPRGMIPDSPGSVRVMDATWLSERAMPALADGEIEQIVFVPQTDDLGPPFRALAHELKQWTFDYPSEPLGVMIDELGWIESAHRDPPELRRALRNCEPEIFHVFVTCHRPIDIPVNTRAIADYWLLFHCVQEHDVNVIRDRCNDTVAQAVQKLQGRSFVLYDDADGKHREYPESAPGIVSPWYVPLRSIAERESAKPLLTELDSRELRKSPIDSKLVFD